MLKEGAAWLALFPDGGGEAESSPHSAATLRQLGLPHVLPSDKEIAQITAGRGKYDSSSLQSAGSSVHPTWNAQFLQWLRGGEGSVRPHLLPACLPSA